MIGGSICTYNRKMTTSKGKGQNRNASEWLRAFLLGLTGAGVVGLLALFPSNLFIFFAVALVFTVFSFMNRIFFIYGSMTILTFRYLFTISLSYTHNIYFNLNFLRVASDDFPIIKYADEVVGIIAAILIIDELLVRRKRIHFFGKRGNYYGSIFLIITILSSIVNLVNPIQTIYFIQMFLRPILLFGIICSIPFTSEKLDRLFKYVFCLAFAFQLIFSVLQNLARIKEGSFLWGDLFIGTFMLPLSPISAGLLAFAFFIFLGLFIVNQHPLHFLGALLAFWGIINAQAGFMTVILVFSVGIWIFYVGVNTRKMNLRRFAPRLSIILFISTIVSLVMILIFSPQTKGWDVSIGYPIQVIEKRIRDPFAETQKFLSYRNFWSIFKSEGKIVLGVGPAEFLTGAAGKVQSKLTRQYSSLAVLGEVGAADFLENDTVGLIGEVGVIGWFTYIFFYVWTLLALSRMVRKISDPIWKGRTLGVFGGTIFILLYSFGWIIFESPVEPVFLWVLFGIVYKYYSSLEINGNRWKNKIVSETQVIK